MDLKIKPKGILAFDIDGTLTMRNTDVILPEELPELLRMLDAIGYFSVPVTGKPIGYAEHIFEKNKISNRGIIAENAGVYKLPGMKEPRVFGEGLQSMCALREAIGLQAGVGGRQNIHLEGNTYEVAIEREDVSILTIFTDPSRIHFRYKFQKTVEVEMLHQKIQTLIQTSKWTENLELLAPFPDGALQILRKDSKTGRVIDKSFLAEVVREMFGQSGLPLAMFGDGHNDISAMQSEGVIPLTFANAEDAVRRVAREKNGFISSSDAPEGLGVVECLYWLTESTTFFGSDAKAIREIIEKYFTLK